MSIFHLLYNFLCHVALLNRDYKLTLRSDDAESCTDAVRCVLYFSSTVLLVIVFLLGWCSRYCEN